MSKDNNQDKRNTEIEYKKLNFNAREEAVAKLEKEHKNVFDAVIEHHRKEEFDRRVEIVKKVIIRYNTLKKQVDDTKPNTKGTYNAAGVYSGEVYSADAWEGKMKKIREMNKIAEAMDLFREKGDFTKLDEFKNMKDAE